MRSVCYSTRYIYIVSFGVCSLLVVARVCFVCLLVGCRALFVCVVGSRVVVVVCLFVVSYVVVCWCLGILCW